MRRTLTLLACAVAFALAGGCDLKSDAAGRESPREIVRMPAAAGARVIVLGCRAEDSCRQNYRPNGRWVIVRRAGR